jgi:SAM-dependent methyltransferase
MRPSVPAERNDGALVRHAHGSTAADYAGAIARTVRRYGSAPRGDRFYVSFKLRLDPVLRELTRLGPFGSVLDAGCGRGQLGICLIEAGLVSQLVGFDYDARKVALASAAAPEAQFVTADAESFAFSQVDTVLLVDVLHYLEPEAQDALLLRAVSALAVGGRILVREVGGKRPGGSWLTRSLEHLGAKLGINRARTLSFRPLEELTRVLERLGLECQTADASQGTPLSNSLIVATRR